MTKEKEKIDLGMEQIQKYMSQILMHLVSVDNIGRSKVSSK